MAKHEFGGDWTTDKLERLRKYLAAYTTIFRSNPRARLLTTIYVDAFAGTGHHVKTVRGDAQRGDARMLPDEDVERLREGSARVALETDPSFDRFLFIERHRGRFRDLQALRDMFPERADDIQIERADANAYLNQWCDEMDWGRNRAVVFLDPYGMQVDWDTLEALARTRAVDLWILFPLGVAVNRLLMRSRPPTGKWASALTRTFGTEEWKAAFYPKQVVETLYGVDETQRREATIDAIGNFFLDRLKDIFVKVAPNPLPLLNSTSTPIYLLCFAAGNPKGAPTAVKIASHILKP